MKDLLKLISLLLVFVLLFTFVACNEVDDNGNNDPIQGDANNSGDQGNNGGNSGGNGNNENTPDANTLLATTWLNKLSDQFSNSKSIKLCYETVYTDGTNNENSHFEKTEAIFTEDQSGIALICTVIENEYGTTLQTDYILKNGILYERGEYEVFENEVTELPKWHILQNSTDDSSVDSSALSAILETAYKALGLNAYKDEITSKLTDLIKTQLDENKIVNGSWEWKQNYAAKLNLFLAFADNINEETETLRSFLNRVLGITSSKYTVDDILNGLADISKLTVSDIIKKADDYLVAENTSLQAEWNAFVSSETFAAIEKAINSPEITDTLKNLTIADIKTQYGELTVDELLQMAFNSLIPSEPDYDDDLNDAEFYDADDSGEINFTESLIAYANTMLDFTLSELEFNVSDFVYAALSDNLIEIAEGDEFSEASINAKLTLNEETNTLTDAKFTATAKVNDRKITHSITVSDISSQTITVSAPKKDDIFAGVYGDMDETTESYDISISATEYYGNLWISYFDEDYGYSYALYIYTEQAIYYGSSFEATIWASCISDDTGLQAEIDKFNEEQGEATVTVTLYSDFSFTIDGFNGFGNN